MTKIKKVPSMICKTIQANQIEQKKTSLIFYKSFEWFCLRFNPSQATVRNSDGDDDDQHVVHVQMLDKFP